MIKMIFQTVNIQLLSFLRIKQAVFWSLVFPLFIFVIFSSIFGTFFDKEYTYFLMTGVIGMSIASDGLFAIGTTIKNYYNNGTIRILKKMPINILYYFTGIIICRFIISFGLVICLNITSIVLFSCSLKLADIIGITLGIFIGLWIFSFLGLCLTFSDIKVSSSDKGLINLVYFVVLFTSNSLYPISSFNEKISYIANFLPLNPILSLLRSETFMFFHLALWAVLPVILFYFLYKRLKVVR